MMAKLQNQFFSLFSLSLILFLHLSGQAEAHRHRHHAKKLFVFGDSYVDTGNTRIGELGSWKEPYGITFPGKPAGRFSDGRVFTDYVAKYLRLRSPLPYKFRKVAPQYLKHGLNFAYGGTGVFNTSSSNPNMTVQINFFKQLIQEKVFSHSHLRKSVALVSVAGNDYNFYLATNGSLEDFPSFIASVVNQTTTNLIRLQKLGVRKIIVNGLQPTGCLPGITTTSSFQRCNSTFNNLALFHNTLLNQSVAKLNQEAKGHATFAILNLYDSFLSILNDTSSGNTTDKFKPCCFGVSSEYFCGSVDKNNVKKYVVCENPKSAFFWDLLHPTQAGWDAVFHKLNKNGLHQLQ